MNFRYILLKSIRFNLSFHWLNIIYQIDLIIIHLLFNFIDFLKKIFFKSKINISFEIYM